MRCTGAIKASIANLVRVAGRRWEMEVDFEATKGACGLDHYEVRRWQGWYRHITLSLLAHAVLVALRAQAPKISDGRSCAMTFAGDALRQIFNYGCSTKAAPVNTHVTDCSSPVAGPW